MPSNEAPISINLKTLGGTQITLRAETSDEFTLLTSTIFQIVEAVGEVEIAVRGNAPVNLAVPMNPQIGTIASSLGGTVFDASPGVGSRMCPHGTMTRIHGLTGKFGPYKGYFCPSRQGDPSKCANQYLKPNEPGWNTFTPDQTKQ